MSEDEYVDEELLLDGTWGSFEGVPNPEYLKLKKKVDAEKVKKEEDGQAAASAAADKLGRGHRTFQLRLKCQCATCTALSFPPRLHRAAAAPHLPY